MRGETPTIGDIVLEELVMPINLLCNEPSESLSPDCEGEEEQLEPYRVESHCYKCGVNVRVCVVCTAVGIRFFEELLLQELSFICTRCTSNSLQHGRPN
uniref:Protein E7 n=1 Tax=Human papillomavirus TaxID=10566 RepID=A0A346TID4_9PAPI|nr:E7 protein [Human papillomavirus]